MEYIIYADESDLIGPFFSNFYGGALVTSKDKMEVEESLYSKAHELNLTKEIKWQKVSEAYLDKYKQMMTTFFDFVNQSKLKTRIMFTQNLKGTPNLTDYQQDRQYHLLYYQFLKNCFGLKWAPPGQVRFYLDVMPTKKAHTREFKAYVNRIGKLPEFRRLEFPIDQIAEVDSHDHIILQCVDVVLGAMQFRLNKKHQDKPPGQRVRGRRTIAKEKLYKHIYQQICQIRPRFNIGCSTGWDDCIDAPWAQPYRHWLFNSSR